MHAPLQSQTSYNYAEGIARMLDRSETRLIVNLDDLRDYDRELANGCVGDTPVGVRQRHASQSLTLCAPPHSLLLEPTAYLPAFDDALMDQVDALKDARRHDTAGKDCGWPWSIEGARRADVGSPCAQTISA